MRIRKIKKFLEGPKPVIISLAAVLVTCFLFAVFGYAAGSPIHDWVSSVASKTHAISYYLVLILLVIGMTFVNNLVVAYLSLVIFLFLCSFLKVASLASPGIGKTVEVILLIYMLIVIFKNEEDAA